MNQHKDYHYVLSGASGGIMPSTPEQGLNEEAVEMRLDIPECTPEEFARRKGRDVAVVKRLIRNGVISTVRYGEQGKGLALVNLVAEAVKEIGKENICFLLDTPEMSPKEWSRRADIDIGTVRRLMRVPDETKGLPVIKYGKTAQSAITINAAKKFQMNLMREW